MTTMVDQPFVVIGSDVIGTVSKHIKIPTLSTSDTLTFPDLSAVLAFSMYKESDMTTTIAGTIATNVITITTAALTNIAAVALVTGLKKK
jgi:hypothetical protein